MFLNRFINRTFKVGRLNHVAIAIPDATKHTAFFRDTLNLPPQPEHGVYTTFIELENTKVELLEPLGGESSPIARFIEKNPKGAIHHLCYEVDNLNELIEHLSKKGIKPLEPPKIGAHGNPVIFLHPKECGGVLTEFEEIPSEK